MRIPLPALLGTPEARSTFGWIFLRVALAALLAIHGWARWIAGGVPPFGAFLDAQGLPGGFFIAAAITAVEILGSFLFAIGRFVPILAAIYAAIIAAGILLVHAKEGWFVVGLGRNGAEFSVLLLVALLCVGLQHVRATREI
jgi:putative oxidoreductase